ncbi:hypothetical protein HPB51_008052 [Rhipicephalus microplus]|uniref:Tick transposon n=1 Tax=Rhipicephalus microplus TaxID=6941 RepID=A0A9J6EFY9_RHIMP|nr:hypothetical protein HPB51_008052 [Rhipicephalus microplus]
MQPYQQAQIATLIDFISRSTGSFVHVLRDPSGVVALIVNAVCKARTLSFSIRNKILPEDVRALFGGCTPSDGHRTRIMKIQRSEWLRQVRLFRAYLRAQMHRTYESYAAEIHFRKHLRLADQMIEFHWKLQLRLLRDLVDKVRVSATSNVHVAEGICLPDFVLEVLGLGPKFAVQPQKNKPELVSIVRQVSKRVPEDQATRIINEALIVNAVCKARTLSFSIRNKILPEDVRALFGGCTPSDGHRTRIMKIQRSEWLRQVRLFRAYLRAQMHRTYESYAAEIHFRKHLRLADQMIEFHWKLQLRLLRDLVDKVRVSATSNVHVAEGICLPDFVLEVLGLGPKFAVQPQKNKPELVSIVRQVSKRVPEDQATRIINEDEKTCWCYEPRASKPLLQFHSAHTKLVKRGIAKMCLSEALKKSCRCLMNESFRQQVSRLSNAGYPRASSCPLLKDCTEKCWRKDVKGWIGQGYRFLP